MGTNHSIPADYSVPTYALVGVQLLLITLSYAARTVSRKFMKAPVSIDDVLAFIAYLANIGLLASALLLTAMGTLDLRTLRQRTSDQNDHSRRTFCALAVHYVLTITFIKLSILFFYRRTFTMFETWFRWAWWACMSIVLLWSVTCTVLIAQQELGILPKKGFSRIGISTTGVVNGFSDMLLIVLPAVMVSRMKLHRKQKLAIIAIFMIGGIAAIVSTVRGVILFSNRQRHLNKAYSNYLDVVLASTEASAGLMCACLPLTKPVVARATRKIQRWRGLDTAHQGWTTNATATPTTTVGSGGNSSSTVFNDKERGILRVDNYHVQLLPASHAPKNQQSSVPGSILDGRDAIREENPW